MDHLKAKIRHVPDFPEGHPLLRHHDAAERRARVSRHGRQRWPRRSRAQGIDAVVGIESRGFILGARGRPNALGCRVRRRFASPASCRRLPSRETYQLEYGTDALEIHKDAVSQAGSAS